MTGFNNFPAVHCGVMTFPHPVKKRIKFLMKVGNTDEKWCRQRMSQLLNSSRLLTIKLGKMGVGEMLPSTARTSVQWWIQEPEKGETYLPPQST